MVSRKTAVAKEGRQIKTKLLAEENNHNLSSEEEYFCLQGCESFSDNIPGEGWI